MAWGDALGGAGQGAAAGFAIGGPVGAGIGAAVGGLWGWISGNEKDAAQDDAVAMQKEALAEQRRIVAEQMAEQRQVRAEAQRYAQATPEELANLRQMTSQARGTLEQQMSQIKIDQEMLASVDPSIRAAGEETLKLLRGEESRILAPLQRQRDTQREQLKARLREQLGPGYETTSAGMRALSGFDTQTADLVQTTQQNTISSLMGLTVQGLASRPDIAGRMGNAASLSQNSLANVLQGQQNIQNRMVAATKGIDYSGQNNLMTSVQNTASNIGNVQMSGANQSGQTLDKLLDTAGTFGAMQTAQAYQDKQTALIEKNIEANRARAGSAPQMTLGSIMPQYNLGVNYGLGG